MESPIATDGPARDRQWVIHLRLSTGANAALLAALLFFTAACGIGGPSGAGWRDTNLHAVDGIWITGEEPCGPTSSDDLCRAARVAALARVRKDHADTPPQEVVALATLPSRWFNTRGEQVLMITGGISRPAIVIVDLSDGRRVAVGLICDPTITSVGQPARAASCFDVATVLEPYRVGGKGPDPFGDAP